MQYGHFDVANLEYVITRPDTPTPWINYLGQGDYTALVSNTGGGTSFFRDPMHMRVLRYRINSFPIDRSGRYFYLRDTETGEYWSPTWQPVMEKPEFYECRHGLGYTKIALRRGGIDSEVLYTVPLNAQYELWRLKITNNSGKKRSLKVFTYAEFTHYSAKHDFIYSWTNSASDANCANNVIVYKNIIVTNEKRVVFCSVNKPADGYDCAVRNFIGSYNSETNPLGLERGSLTDSNVVSDDCCAAFSVPIELGPGKETEISVILGVADNRADAETITSTTFAELDYTTVMNELYEYWEKFCGNFQLESPDEEVNNSLNTWNQYQLKITFDWSRFISYYERGMDRGMGYRDTMQDTLGIMHSRPDLALKTIKMMLGVQNQDGSCMCVYFPHVNKAETEGARSDDHFWGIVAVCAYIKETGDISVLEHQVPYYDGGSGSILEHIERGINFTLRNLGDHGLPLFLVSDWNDTLRNVNKSGKAESAFVFFQFAHALNELIPVYRRRNDAGKLDWAEKLLAKLSSLENQLWDGEWYIRGYDLHGDKFGSDKEQYNKIFLNPQSWATMSGIAPQERCNRAFDSVGRLLNSEFGIHLVYPGAPFYDVERKGYCPVPAGGRENGGIFFHSNTWAVIAAAMLGRNEQAFEFYKHIMGSNRNDRAEICGTEPYVFSQHMYGQLHPRYGWCTNSWLSGTASWTFVAATQYILGIRPDFDGLLIDPKIPRDWKGFKATRAFRGKTYHISVNNKSGKALPVTFLSVNGQLISGNLIRPEQCNGNEVQVEVEI